MSCRIFQIDRLRFVFFAANPSAVAAPSIRCRGRAAMRIVDSFPLPGEFFPGRRIPIRRSHQGAAA